MMLQKKRKESASVNVTKQEEAQTSKSDSVLKHTDNYETKDDNI